MYYILFYETVENFEESRIPYRKDHFNHIKNYVDKGQLALGGALQEPADRALLVFESENPDTAIEFAKKDPYVVNGLIKNWEVRPWNVLVGTKV